MTIHLRNMRPDELAAFRNYSVNDYADELMHDQALYKEAAILQAEQEFDELLPDSRLLVIEHNACSVGVLWYMTEDTDGVRHVFLNDFIIDPAHRRKGYGRAALEALALLAQEHNCTEIRLYAANDNQPALQLYESCGYQLLRPFGAGCYLHKAI